MARTGKPATRRVAAVERAASVIDALAEGGELDERAARRTGLHPSSVSRLLSTLADSGLVEHVPETGRYRLGLRLIALGNAVLARLDLREVARPHLRALVEETGETATLSARRATPTRSQSTSSRAPPRCRASPASGARAAHATATGKVALAFGDVALPPGRLHAFTGQTIADRATPPARSSESAGRAGRGPSASARSDLNALAAPVRGSDGELAAVLGIQGPASRFGEEAMTRALEPLLAV